MSEHSATVTGLDNVIAAATALSDVDGEGGRLVLRGREIRDLVRVLDFEKTVALLWQEVSPPPDARGAFGRARVAAFGLVPRYLAASQGLGPVEGVQLGFSLLPLLDAESPTLAVGAVPVFLAAVLRARQGRDAIAPDPAASTAADFLRMLHGRAPAEAEARALDRYLTTVADHGLNASTFAARVVASTRSDLASAMAAALAALKGPLHGGAPGPVLDMLDAIGTEANAEAWLEAAITRGDRLMGFGHRIYKSRDPRADVLREAVGWLDVSAGRIALARHVEKVAVAVLARLKPGRRLDVNVEFYTALLLEALGLPRDAFTGVFAMGRVAGWVAHVFEERAKGRIIRPKSLYVGPRAA
ncbi:MAG: citrate synthase [Alphaproteobacteria bacterium]|nr:citrate synthase [Alphaproteobacteria bacterium]